MLNQLAQEIHAIAIEKGWWGGSSYADTTPLGSLDITLAVGKPTERNFGEVIALIHSEASEALEEYRNGHELNEIYYRHKNGSIVRDPQRFPPHMLKPEGIPAELADILIRVLDACAGYGIDIDSAITEKIAYNKTRPARHGGKRA